MSAAKSNHAALRTSTVEHAVPRATDPLDDAVPLNGHAAPEPGDVDTTDELISEEERNATGGALPATDDEDNDNDNDDARERDIPDHLVRDGDE